ncbi:MAG TPA: hypothetical protein VF765_38090 [Polyangiaceae bacterium]
MVLEVTGASRILVGGGVANLVLSFLLGWVLSAKRVKGPMEPHRWLLVAHEVSLQEGLLLLGVAVAIPYARLSPGVAELAAWLLVVASLFQDASGIANWLRGIGDQFAQKSAGWVLATINAIVNSVGLGIVAYGVACGLAAG